MPEKLDGMEPLSSLCDKILQSKMLESYIDSERRFCRFIVHVYQHEEVDKWRSLSKKPLLNYLHGCNVLR